MTLILTAITRQSVVMVADMRLTTYGTREVTDEAACKMVVWLGRFLFAYTGPACLEGEPTGAWLARRLSEVPAIEGLLPYLAERATDAIRGLPPLMQTLAIVGAGWLGTPPALRPAYIVVSNFDQATGARLPAVTTARHDLARAEKARVFAAGTKVSPERLAAVEDLVQKRAGRGRARAGDVGAILVQAARKESWSNRTVGRSLQLGSLPEVHRDAGAPLSAEAVPTPRGAPDWRGPEFRLVSGRSGEPEWWMPHAAGFGWTALHESPEPR
jgi:hypothetical protein